MWPSIKRWRDWAMNDWWSMQRIGPQPQALHYSFEKAGLTLHDQPIPWNAEVVLVEALLRLPPPAPRRKSDFKIHLPNQAPIPAESLRPQGEDYRARAFFRIPPPAQTVTAEITWQKRSLGQLTLPVLGRAEFLQQLRLQLPTFFVRLGEQNVACQTFVASQCRGLTASALLSSPTSLVPLAELGLQVEFRSERGGQVQRVPVPLSSSQLAERQALVAVFPRRFPRRIGAWTATWTIADRPLAHQRVRGISQRFFQRSLHVSDTRFIVQAPGHDVRLARQMPPLDGPERVGPCFLVGSKEVGMAGLCTLQVRVQVPGNSQPLGLSPQEVLITDGPTLVTPGTLKSGDLESVSAFELRLGKETLGILPLTPVPAATFNNEGGFKPTGDFAWSAAAEDELNERLLRLLEAGKK